eukprot:96425-Pelagomonas_calceolata.AAC.1
MPPLAIVPWTKLPSFHPAASLFCVAVLHASLQKRDRAKISHPATFKQALATAQPSNRSRGVSNEQRSKKLAGNWLKPGAHCV